MNRTVLKTMDEIKEWFIYPYPIISFDTETTSLDYLTLDLVGISFSIGNDSCYIDIIDNPEYQNILAFLRNLFEQEFKFLIAHNMSFDLKVLSKHNIFPHPKCKLFCTQTAAHLIDENLPKNLNFLVKKYFHIDLKTWEEVKQHGWHSQAFYAYGATDAYYAYELYKIQHPILKLENLDDLFFDIEMPFQKVKIDLETNGILIDRDKLKQLEKELKQMIWNLKIDMCESADIGFFEQGHLEFDKDEKELITELNFNSSQQLVMMITKKLKLKITEETDKGNPSVGEASLKKLRGKHPFIDILRKYKKAIKLYNGFVKPFPNFIQSDERIRCNWHTTVAVTGRVLASKPNLLQLPRKQDEVEIPFEFRSCFIPPEGKKIVVADYAGQELCWLGEVTGDENLINSIIAKKDLHLTTANTIFKLDIPDECLYTDNPDYMEYRTKYKEQRHIGKNGVNFPLIYGKTAYGIAKEFQISKKEAQGWLDGFFSLYPDVRKSIAECHKEIDENGQVVDWFGRVRRLDASSIYRAYRQGFNFLVQSPSASQMKIATTQVRSFFDLHQIWDAKILLMIYDELVYEVDESWVKDSVIEVESIMRDCIKTKVPFTIDIGFGDNYANAKG